MGDLMALDFTEMIKSDFTSHHVQEMS